MAELEEAPNPAASGPHGGEKTSSQAVRVEVVLVSWCARVMSVGPVVKKRSGLPGETAQARDSLFLFFLFIFSTLISLFFLFCFFPFFKL
jgi:hypothetical protein